MGNKVPGVYVLKLANGEIKVGCSNSVYTRIKEYSNIEHHDIYICDDYSHCEGLILNRLSALNIYPCAGREWFSRTYSATITQIAREVCYPAQKTHPFIPKTILRKKKPA